ncbi:class I SAM-dependent methyltransferase [bacterium]|nr:class I SAM-dependent methyltransferase [bacterium]
MKERERTVEEAFDEAAPEYDAWVRQALPTYEELFSVAVEVIPHPADAPISVADLGAGSGLFSDRVFSTFPDAQFTLYDTSRKMLDIARERFAGHSDRFTFVEERLEHFSETQRFDLVISSLAIHHLENAEKQSLFRQVFAALRPGGAFINVDQVRGDPPFGDLYWSTWLSKVRESGAPEPRIQQSVRRRRELDRDAGLVEQLDWLQRAGFDADCIYKHYFIAVFLAIKPAP